jgi:hypothetical protein
VRPVAAEAQRSARGFGSGFGLPFGSYCRAGLSLMVLPWPALACLAVCDGRRNLLANRVPSERRFGRVEGAAFAVHVCRLVEKKCHV